MNEKNTGVDKTAGRGYNDRDNDETGREQKMETIRKAKGKDLARIAEILIFNYRLNFYPIFRDDHFYFTEMQVPAVMEQLQPKLDHLWVFDDGAVKGFMQVEGTELKRLFVEPVLQNQSIGSALLDYAVQNLHVNQLWALEKNIRAIAFYERHGFHITPDRKTEDGTTEYLVRLER